MDWKELISEQLDEASKHRAIGRNLKALAKDLLDGDTEFCLVYSSGREQYTTVRFRNDIGKGTAKIILKEYGLPLLKMLKPKNRNHE